MDQNQFSSDNCQQNKPGRCVCDNVLLVGTLLYWLACVLPGSVAAAREPVPEKLVVLTFDDSVKSHFTIVRPILKQYKFGATFFITEGFDFKTDKHNYMTWDEIAQLHRDGFEIGNHTRDHMSLNAKNPAELQQQLSQLKEQITAINHRCREYGIPIPISFAYPGNGTAPEALPILSELGILFARRGGSPEYPYQDGRGFAYEPGLDHPLLIPSAGDARPDWTLDDFKQAVAQATFGRIAVLQFHGVPDVAHPWVNSSIAMFRSYMEYLAHHGYKVIAMRDLATYVDPTILPKNPSFVIEDRIGSLQHGTPRQAFRSPPDRDSLRRWLENMVWYHRFKVSEIRMATGLKATEITAALNEFNISSDTRPKRDTDDSLLVLPYPGGRHPRTGFLDGALRPQRETKLSVFLPWDQRQYVVLDVPEAIRRNDEAACGLLYLAHTHVDTMWTKQGIELEALEWQQDSDGAYAFERELPNHVVFGTRATVGKDHVRMEMWLTNGSRETLTELRVQNCVLLKGAPEFINNAVGGTIKAEPFLARRSKQGNHWLITAWEPCQRVWDNPPCPCLHSDPQFPDCSPGETKRLRGWLSFYTGDDIQGEMRRIADQGWLSQALQ